MNKTHFFILSFLILSVIFTFLSVKVLANTSNKTLINLNKAFKGETNASHRYELFAQQADKEGYKDVAKLFRAASMAEAIHRNNHKAVILELGEKPDVIEYDAVKLGTTKENLKSPVEGEAYEKSVMYPEFINQAKSDKIPLAVKTFSYSVNAENQHEKLFEEA